MNAVFGFTQLLGMDDLTHDQDAAVQQILRGGRHLVARIDDVLDIAKIETDRLDLTLEALLMSELLSDTVALMMPVAKSANIALSFNQTDGANQHVLGDSHHLRQVVLNLLSNAIKIQPARRPGRGPVRTVRTHRCRYRRPRHRHRHPGRQLPRLFTPFDRLGAQSSTIAGSGVGLALSHRLITTMGGSLTATSELGIGSVFRASVPLATPASLPPALPGPTTPADTHDPTTVAQVQPMTCSTSRTTTRTSR